MIVAVLLGGGALLGASALAIDVGNMMFERRQLQNGADSAARKMATTCAQDLTKCDVTRAATLTDLDNLNDLNASDNEAARNGSRADIPSGICGRVPGAANMPACPADALTASADQWTTCPALPPAFASGAAPYVQLYTLTATATSTGVLDSFLGGTDSAPGACARYAWGRVKSASTFPLTFAECEVNEALALGYAVESSFPLKYKSHPSVTACDPTTVPAGGDYFGGFGWLANTDCNVTTTIPGWTDGDTGVGAGNACVSDLVVNQVYLLPIFTCVSDSNAAAPCVPGSPGGTNTWYYLDRYEAFKLTGYRMASTGGWEGSPSTAAKNECNAESLDNKCITGYFIEDYIAGDGEIDPTTPAGSSGPFAFQPIG